MIRVSDEKAQVDIAKVYRANQEHIFRFWDDLPREESTALLEQIEAIDFQLLERLSSELVLSKPKPASRVITPPDLVEPGADPAADAEARKLGAEALAAGKVAAFLVAGGEGTRLGFEGPKGTYPIGPVTKKSLFHLLAEQILATSRRFKTRIPWFIMVSRATHDETARFFQDQTYFGLARADIHFLEQGELPVVDARGRLVLAERGRIATAPTGHGGAIPFLGGPVLDLARERGIEWISYFQVDNPLLRVLDPLFVGRAALERAEVGIKVCIREDPAEPVGLVCYADGRLSVIEYTEISDELRLQRSPGGELKLRAANTGAHLFSKSFLEKLTGFRDQAHHASWKAVPHVNNKGMKVEPETPNAVKFETFIFDSFRLSERAVVLAVPRSEEFHPLKRADGDVYTPVTVRQALVERAARWLERCRVPVERNGAGEPRARIEISPLFALDPEELREKVAEDLVIGEELSL